MKKLNSSINAVANGRGTISLLMLLLLLSLTKTMNAQFTKAAIVETSPIDFMDTGFPGNAVLDYHGITYEVVSYQEVSSSEAGIAWYESNGNTSGYSSFTTTADVIMSDVCLLIDGGDVYAVATYYVDGSTDTYYCEVFVWDGFYNTFVITSRFTLATGSFGNTLHIETDGLSYAIVWDEGGQINVATGDVTQIFNSGTPVTFSNFSTAVMPDVAMMYDGTTEWVKIAWLENPVSSPKILYVEDNDLADLAAGTHSPTNLLNELPPTSGGVFAYPRIACAANTQTIDDWTVVVAESDGSTFWNIQGWNSVAGSPPVITGPITYNDGVLVGTNITGVVNEYPVVTYDSNYPTEGIWVGWTMDNSGGGFTGSPPNATATAKYPIVAKCDNVALPAVTTFWEVPYVLSSGTGDEYNYLSLSGRDATDKIYLSWWTHITGGSTSDDVYAKEVSASVCCSLRVANTAMSLSQFQYGSASSLFELRNNSAIPVNLKLFDLSGKVVLALKGASSNIIADLKLGIENMPASIYLAQLISDDGIINISQKIFLRN